MSLLAPDAPCGDPAFALSADQVATVLDLVCQGADGARSDVSTGMLEVPTTVIVRKAMRRVKKSLGLTNLQIRGEHEIDDMATTDPGILGRIDVTLQFLHQFGNEDAFVAIECKRVQAGNTSLNYKYVSEGVERFASSKYGVGHQWGFMLGYVLGVPVETITDYIDGRLKAVYGADAAMVSETPHPKSLAVHRSALKRSTGGDIHLKHIFVDMICAAPAGGSLS